MDVLRRATGRQIADTMIAAPLRLPQATHKQAIDLEAAILAALRKCNGGAVWRGIASRMASKHVAVSRLEQAPDRLHLRPYES